MNNGLRAGFRMWGRSLTCAPIAQSAQVGRVDNPPQDAILPHTARYFAADFIGFFADLPLSAAFDFP
jgi:hypothetical protein